MKPPALTPEAYSPRLAQDEDTIMKVLRITPVFVVLVALSYGSGCAPTQQEILTFLNGADHTAVDAGYRLGPTDYIRVISLQAPEVNREVVVRADGTVHLDLLGNVRVAGLTPREAAAKIQQELRLYYVDPKVDVSVNTYNSKMFTVHGEIVGGQGGGAGERNTIKVPVTGHDTILNVLSTYPPTFGAWLEQVHLIRPDPKDPKKNQTLILDVSKMLTGGDLRQNYILQEGDILWVPPTPLAWVGYRIREVLQPINPALDAYTRPAAFKDANEEYKGQDDNNKNTGVNLLNQIRLP